MEFILVLMNILPVLAVGYIASALTIFFCNHKSRGTKYVLISVAFKYFVVNMLNLYCLIYTEQGKLMFLLEIVCVSITCLVYKKFLSDSFDKLFFVAIVSDCRSMCCTQGSITIVSYVWHYNLMEHTYELPGKYNLIIISFAIVFLILTQIMGKELFRYIREKRLRYPKLWNVLLFIYYVAGAYLASGLEWFFSHKSTLVFAVIVFSVVFIFREKKKQLLEISNSYLLLQQNMILQYYDSLKEQIDLTQKMRHDINNHMQIIESIRKENDGEALASYTKDLKAQYERLEPVYYCNNVVINALLVNKNKKCQKENISFEVDLREIDLGNISEYDFAGILFNLLDNAIESCLKIPDKTKRFIHLKCFSDAGQLLISVENSCIEKESKEKTGLFTSKPDKKRHGVGMRIIGETVKKYGGGMEIKHCEYKFEALVNISMDK